MTPHVVDFFFWGLLWTFWLGAAFWASNARYREGLGLRLLHLVPLGLGTYLLLERYRTFWIAGELYATGWESPVSYIGMAMTAAGVGLCVWARIHLGRHWSGVITLKQGHELIDTGPYAYVRHPIYSGWLLAMLGTALAAGTGDGFLAVGIVGAAFGMKMMREERLLTRAFGPVAQAYRQKTPALLIPYIL